MTGDNFIKIRGARVHNLKNIDVDIPRNKLVVITGLSGSGKSSLAFDTIYAEGQRRYVESLSAYARQFLGVMQKPDVDKIEGISPAIAIDQRSVSRNPRSTIGTITEIYDYLRLLFARIGKPHCPKCADPVAKQTIPQIVDQILKLPPSNEIIILGPVVRGRKGEHKGILEEIQRAGFLRVRIDGIIYPAEEALALDIDKMKRHDIEVVVDRLETKKSKNQKTKKELDEDRMRIMDSVETALKIGKGLVIISNFQPAPHRPPPLFGQLVWPNQFLEKRWGTGAGFPISKKSQKTQDLIFSEQFACEKCGINLPEVEPRLFSFNSPYGACQKCTGLGSLLKVDPDLVIPNKNLTLAEGAIRPWMHASHRVGRQSWYWEQLADLSEKYNFSLHTPIKNLPKKIIDSIIYGDGYFEGVMANLERRYLESASDWTRAELEKYMIIKKCDVCQGKRLKPEALAVTVAGVSIDKATAMSISGAKIFFETIFESGIKNQESGIRNKKKKFHNSKFIIHNSDLKIAEPIIKEILNRLQFLIDVGLDYLTLDRESTSLAGGEAQRIQLATQIGSRLTGVTYILDEPSIGLHPRDQGKLIGTLKRLRDLQNTIIVVEHDPQTILSADWVIDIGPGAGKNGGKVMFEGMPKELLKSKTLTGDYLAGRRKVEITLPPKLKIKNEKLKTTNKNSRINFLIIRGAKEHNLKNIDVKIPLGRFICVTGVSGSGKSTLVNDILAKALFQKFYKSKEPPGEHRGIEGAEHLNKVVLVDQSPIGRTPRSNPATYTGAFSFIRDLFTKTREARIRGYNAGRFSFNVKGGRCEVCEGQGVKKVEMYFLPDVYVECEACQGKRYTDEALQVEYRGKNIYEVLRMTVEEALQFFKDIPGLRQKLQTLYDVGLGYVELGQSAPSLSGGEAQRIKLSEELSKKETGKTLYILDEPTTGLHFDDIKKLLTILSELVIKENTVLVIEHNLDVIKNADWIIDLGPEGGDKGGKIMAEGTPREIAKTQQSSTGQYLKGML